MAGRTRTHGGKTYTLSAAHPAADLFPWMEDDELQDLADDIRANKLKHKIVRHRGVIVDGRNRELACLVAGVRPEYADLPSDTPEETILRGVLSANVRRRHLSASQRAMIAAELEATKHGGSRRGPVQDANLRLENPAADQDANLRLDRETVAGQLNVSPRSVNSAAKVKNEAPELVRPVADGKLPVSVAAKAADLPAKDRAEIAEADAPAEVAKHKLNGTLPRPRIDASPAARPHPIYGDRKRPARKLREHRYGEILADMRDLSRKITLAINEPDGTLLKDYLRFVGYVIDRGFILNGKKYNARFKGFPFRHAVKIATGKGRRKTKDELRALCREQWGDESDMEDWVPE